MGKRARPITRTPADPEEATPTATPPGPEPDPIAAAIASLKAQAAEGCIKSIRALTDGTLDRLRDLAAGGKETWPAVNGTTKTACPGCGHVLRISVELVDLGRGPLGDALAYLRIHVLDLTDEFSRPLPYRAKPEAGP